MFHFDLYVICTQDVEVTTLKMSACLRKNWHFIQLLVTTNVSQRLVLFKTSTDDQLSAICEIVLNTLQGNLYIPPDKVKNLKKHKNILRSLSSATLSKRKKRKILITNSKVIVELLSTVQPLLETYMG